MTRRTYWIKFPRNFANEFSVGVATNGRSASQYRTEGYESITRERALRELSWRGDNATRAYVDASIDGRDQPDRFELARNLCGRW